MASLDADDSRFCSAAVPGDDVRIGWEIGTFAFAASSRALEMRRKKEATTYRLDVAPIIAKGLATYLQFI